MTKIYISPSDQTENPYAVGGTNEAVQCQRIGEALEAALNRIPGIEARCNRTGDISKAITESNAWGSDYHISCHTNAFNGIVAGTRVFYYPGNEKGKAMADSVSKHLAPITPGTSDNVTTAEWGEMRNCTATSVYVESGFHDNQEEAEWIIGHTTDIGEAIAAGIVDVLGLNMPTAEPTTDTLYGVQVGAFRVKENAERMRDKLAAAGYPGYIVEGKL